MPRYTAEQLKERREKLPPMLRDAIFDPAIADKMYWIGKSNGLTIEQLGYAVEETGYIILGLTKPKDFVASLKERLGVAPDIAKKIASDINRQIFFPLREALKQAHEFDVSEEAIQKGEALIAGLAKPPPAAALSRPEPQQPVPTTQITGRFPAPETKPIEPAAKPASQPTPPPTSTQQPLAQKPAPGAIVPPKYAPGAPKITIQPITPASMSKPPAPVPAPPKPSAPPQPPKPTSPGGPKPIVLTKPPFSKPPDTPPAEAKPPFSKPPAPPSHTQPQPRPEPPPEPQPLKPAAAIPTPPSSKVPPIDLRAQAKQPEPTAPAPLSKPARYGAGDPYREPVE